MVQAGCNSQAAVLKSENQSRRFSLSKKEIAEGVFSIDKD
jgi:hypothetical protein